MWNLPAEAAGRLGAVPDNNGGCTFRVWAPRAQSLELEFAESGKRFDLLAAGEGYFAARLDSVPPGALYWYRFPDGRRRPDPASRSQPRGVHGPSAVVSLDYRWRDRGWKGCVLEDLVFYELHAGAFTHQGSFDAIHPRLRELRELGITALELMPVAQFPGTRNWGYDGAFPYAVQHSYGGPSALMRLVEAAHRARLAVFLDVVYNHLGPEGNYLSEFGPYFTEIYKTPWGAALNYDGAESDHVRRYFIANALEWVRDYHLDGLRLDAIHGIVDHSATPFLAELAEAAQQEGMRLGRRVQVIAESNLNDSRVLRSRSSGGLGMDAQWSDDFHHALHTALTGECEGYYADFHGAADLPHAIEQGYVYQGQYSIYRRRRHGNSTRGIPPQRFVICAQNHDQVGNRAGGERLSVLVGLEALKLAALAWLAAPQLPLLFMGEEYGEPAPFLYFIEHGDPGLVEAVRRGRHEEFADFQWPEPPDPQSPATFAASRLNWHLRRRSPHRELLAFHRELLRLRRRYPALAAGGRARCERAGNEGFWVLRTPAKAGTPRALIAMNFHHGALQLRFPFPGQFRWLLATGDRRWKGPGAALPRRLERGVEMALPAWSGAAYLEVENSRKSQATHRPRN